MFIRKYKAVTVAIGMILVLALGMQGVTPAHAGNEALQAGTTYRVTPTGATSGPCGSDWSTPCDLQYALSIATFGAEIWVASGIYHPDQGAGQIAGERASTFLLKNGVAMYGGFAGTETLLSQRNQDPSQNGTVLSGDLGTQGGNADNTYHVVTASFVYGSTILDGFTITGGNANAGEDNFGGGLYSNESSLLLKNILFTGNTTNGGGGGMFAISQRTVRADYSTPTLEKVVFTNNSAARGGGMATQNSNPSLTDVIFKNNTASGQGGGMANWTLNTPSDEYSLPVLTNVTFTANISGGGGGLFNSNSQPALTNVTFSGNSASIRGGAIFNNGGSPTLKNVTFTGNTAPATYGGAIRNDTFSSVVSVVTMENSILWGDGTEEITGDGTGSLTIVDSIVQGGCPAGATCTNILSTNPVLSGLADHGGFTTTVALGQGSSAINAGGANSTCATVDQRGASRPQGAGCDIGAFEAYLLTVTADSINITYGMAEPTFTLQYGGLLSGDTAGMIDTPPTCGVTGAHTTVGAYTITCSGGVDDKYILFAYVNGTLTIDKMTPILTVNNSPVTYDGAGHSASVVSSVPGNVSNILTGGAASQANAGTYAVTANFIPADTANYNTLTDASAGNFVINKKTPTLSVSNSPVTYNTSPQTPSLTSSVPGTINNVLVGGSASQTNVGTYAVTANFTPDDAVNYNTLTGASAGNFVINKATPTLSVTNSPITYDGAPHSATVTGSVTGTVSNVLTGGFISRTNAGTYAVTANFVPADTANYNSLTGTPAGNFVINKATPVLSVTNSPVTYNGVPRAAGVQASAPGTISNILTGGTLLQTNAGTYLVTANFTPTDTTNYNSLTNASAGNFVINKAMPSFTVTNSPMLYDGLPHSPLLSTSVPGTISNILAGGSASQADLGTYTVTVDFTPTDAVNYHTLSGASVGNFKIKIDITPPATLITIQPSSPSSQNVTFQFTSDDPTAIFECQLDGSGFSACTSPKNYAGLISGYHTFMVRAVDPYDNADITPASYTWTVVASQNYYMESRVITPLSITSQGGSTNGPVTNLWYLEQSGVDNNANAFVNFQTPRGIYFGYHSYYIPNDIQTNLVSSLLLQINFNGPDSSTQIWSWSIYDWTSKLWIDLGGTAGATPDQWNSITFRIKNFQRFISPEHEIRIRLMSSNAVNDLKVDYAALHITYRTTTAPAPIAPAVPSSRPGVASAVSRTVR